MVRFDTLAVPRFASPARLPFYSLLSPGMPAPGKSFVDAAQLLGDEAPQLGRDAAGQKITLSCGAHLERLYYEALYIPGFTLPVLVKGQRVSAAFLRGHLWGYQASGPRRARVLVVGKWPGMEEVQLSRNFVGPSGAIAVRALQAAGVKPEEYATWYVSNAVRHVNLNPAGTAAAQLWLQNCRPLLEQELRLVRPDFILALGSEAAKELIDTNAKIDSVQGQVFTRRIRLNQDEAQAPKWHEAKVMACIHPARVARAADQLPEFMRAIRRFVQLCRGELTGNEVEAVDHRLIWTERDLAQLVDEIIVEGQSQPDPQIIAVDCEWHGDYPTETGAWLRTLQFSHKPGFAACLVLRQQGGAPAFSPSIKSVIPHLKRLLVAAPARRVRLAGHNLRADLPWITLGLDCELGNALIAQYTAPLIAEETRTQGGFDTMLAAHAVTEAPGEVGFKLEVLALNICGVKRYDVALQNWKTEYCKEHKLAAKELEGYGECPNKVMLGVPTEPLPSSPYTVGTSVKDSYACWDADSTSRLVEAYNKPGGLLDHDQYGNNSREPFRLAMGASPGFLEMEMTGLLIDGERGTELTASFIRARDELTVKLRQAICWDNFNPGSALQCKTLLFGPGLANKRDKLTGEIISVAPPGARTFRLYPVTTTGKPPRGWDWVVRQGQANIYSPSTGRETLGILITQLLKEKPEIAEVIKTLRYTRFASKVLQGTLRSPATEKIEIEQEESELTEPAPKKGRKSKAKPKIKILVPKVDEDGESVYEGGLLSFIHKSDGRVRTHLFQTKETGRASSARPPLQNLSKRREKEYKAILGEHYKYPLRSVVMASPGYVLVEADYMGAELFMLAVQSADTTMIDHCLRAVHPENDPRHYQIHSNVAVKAFKLRIETPEVLEKLAARQGKTVATCGLKVGDPLPPTKSALSDSGNDSLYTAAKTIAFGLPYGRGNAAIIRAVEEEGVFLTESDADIIRETIFTTYPNLPDYLEGCKERVTDPGWMTNCFGRMRRFQQTGVTDGGELQRQACNFPIQSGVADAISLALYWLYTRDDRWTADGRLRYRMVLQIHDAILFEVLIPDLTWFIDTVLPWAMTDMVAVQPCDHSGHQRGSEVYHMSVETAVMTHWGEKLKAETAQRLAIPGNFAK